MKKKNPRIQVGALLMFFIFGVLFLALISRIAFIQATGEVNGHELAVEAANKYQRQSTLTADRGKIIDRNGQIIVEDTVSYKVVAVVRSSVTTNPKKPRHVTDAKYTSSALAEILPLDQARIYEILTRDGDPYQVEFGNAGRGLSYEQKSQIEQLELPGIVITSEKKRFYPNGSFAAYLIGFAQKVETDGVETTVGKMGLEQTYNEQLTGIDGKLKYKSDVRGYLLPSSEKMVEPAQDGNDIYLTIDKTIQSFLEDAMSRVEQEYEPESMMAIVSNPKTGEILAMSQRPTFDPTTREGLDASWLNETIENVIEPGSTMKTFTVAAAIESGNWHPNATYQSGSYRLLDRKINDHNNGKGWGTITYLEGFQRSSNTAMAHQLEIMGYDTLIDYLGRFGFNEKTGIDLPKETSGTILSKYPSNVLTTSYGQGSTVTPIQLMQAFSAITNEGQMMQPYVIDKIVNPNTGELILQSEPVIKGNPVSEDTANQVKQLLASTVTSEAGTAKRFALDGYDVGGKTGTAQVPEKGTGKYANGKNEFLFSFLGMAPVEDPQLIMYVSVTKPKLKGSEQGSDPVSQVFKSVMQNSLMYYNIKPQDTAEVVLTELANYEGKSAEAISIELSNYGIQSVIIGEAGNVSLQYPQQGSMLTKGNMVFLKTTGTNYVPDFTGWSLRNVLVYKQLSGLPIEIVGEGYVSSQSVSPQTIITDDSPIVVKLMTPEQQFKSTPIEEELDEELPEE